MIMPFDFGYILLHMVDFVAAHVIIQLNTKQSARFNHHDFNNLSYDLDLLP